jgi:multidrug efflux system outer membrane protein
VTALRECAGPSTLKWDNGCADYPAVLVAQDKLFTAERAAVGSEVSSLTQIVAFYAALGAGWADLAAMRAPTSGT